MKRKRTTAGQTETVTKYAKKPGRAQKLSTEDVAAVKSHVKGQFAASQPAQAVRRSTRLKAAPQEIALAGLEVLNGPFYTTFEDPDDAKTAMARGCHTAEITIGPYPGVSANMGTDAEGELPGVLAFAKEEYGNHFKSGHVINADFGGSGVDYQNLTCLTDSANSRQKTFDNAIKDARDVLQSAYIAILKGMPKDPDYIDELAYGIKIKITMSEDTWGPTFPDNCISREMLCEAEVVHAPSKEDLEEALGGVSRRRQIATAVSLMEQVEDMVANATPFTVKNRPLRRLSSAGTPATTASAPRRRVAPRRSGK